MTVALRRVGKADRIPIDWKIVTFEFKRIGLPPECGSARPAVLKKRQAATNFSVRQRAPRRGPCSSNRAKHDRV
jgi:hypothetical protein